MKKIISLLLTLLLLFALVGCTSDAETSASPTDVQTTDDTDADVTAEPVELIVFAAASMTETITEIAEMYKEVAPNVTLIITFDSSGTLKTQIEEGADCDVFISAAQKQMNALDITSDTNTEGLDFILSESRVNILENKVVLVVPEGNPAGVASFDDVATDVVSTIALGNSDVPVGQYSEDIFTNMGIWDAIQGKITFGTNVKEVTTWVSEGTVDCGVVYATDANAADLQVIAEASADMMTKSATYPAAVLKASQHVVEAQAFLDYIQSDACAAVFEAAGFSVIK